MDQQPTPFRSLSSKIFSGSCDAEARFARLFTRKTWQPQGLTGLLACLPPESRRYSVTKFLGRGASASVWEAPDLAS